MHLDIKRVKRFLKNLRNSLHQTICYFPYQWHRAIGVFEISLNFKSFANFDIKTQKAVITKRANIWKEPKQCFVSN